jgi:hypothetical protein
MAAGVRGGELIGARADPKARAGTLGEGALPTPPAPSKWSYSMMKSLIVEVEPSSTTLSHTHPRPLSKTTSRAMRTRCVTGPRMR